MSEIIFCAIVVLLYGLLVFMVVWACRGAIKEIDRRNQQQKKAAEDEAKRKKERSDELFEWYDRVSAVWYRVSGKGR